MNYPNIKDQQLFVETIVDWIWSVNIGDDFFLEYLRQSLKSYRNKQLIFFEHNEDRIAINDYSGFYANCVVTFPNAEHLFDHEHTVEALILKSPIELYSNKLKNYKFVDSKEERLVQVSDLVVGILRYWMAFLESKTIPSLKKALDSADEIQKKFMMKIQTIMLYSLSVSTGFKHGIGSNNFESKISFFLEYDFT